MARYDAITQAAIDLLTPNPGGIGSMAQYTRLRSAIEAKHPGALARAKKKAEVTLRESLFEGDPPDYIKRLFQKHRPTARLRWRRSKVKWHGTGHCMPWSGRIVITASPSDSETELRILALHELAHFRGDGHDDAFYREFRRLLVAEHLLRAAQAGDRWRDGKLRKAGRTMRKAAAPKG